MRKAVEAVEQAGAKALILDLRDNPGGLLTSAIEISDLFLTEGVIVSTKDRNGRGRTYEAKAEGTMMLGKPMAVLINKNSASASEIVSAALQDNKRAVVVGERSFGKGSVQKIIDMKTNPPTALKLTTDTYWRPSGVNIHRYEDAKDTDDWGVRPDKAFEVVLKDEERLEYLKFRRARDVIRGKNAPREDKKENKEKQQSDADVRRERGDPLTPENLPKEEIKDDKVKKENKPFQDRALDKAIEYLKTQIK
jgi:carboxyl-terminal processing protease